MGGSVSPIEYGNGDIYRSERSHPSQALASPRPDDASGADHATPLRRKGKEMSLSGNHKFYDVGGHQRGELYRGKTYGVDGHQTGSFYNGKFYDVGGHQTGELYQGKFYDVSGHETGYLYPRPGGYGTFDVGGHQTGSFYPSGGMG